MENEGASEIWVFPSLSLTPQAALINEILLWQFSIALLYWNLDTKGTCSDWTKSQSFSGWVHHLATENHRELLSTHPYGKPHGAPSHSPLRKTTGSSCPLTHWSDKNLKLRNRSLGTWTTILLLKQRGEVVTFDQEGLQCHMNKIRPIMRTLRQPNQPTPRTGHITMDRNTQQSTD